MKKMLLFGLLALLASGTQAQKNAPQFPALKTGADSASYAYGVILGASLKRQMSADLTRDIFLNSLAAALKGDSTLFNPEDANTIFGNFNKQNQMKAYEKNRKDGEAFLNDNKKRKEVITTPSGLQYEVLTKGVGTVSPKATDRVKVMYKGTLIDGTVFDSTPAGSPATFGLNQVIRGWTEGLQYMHAGDKFKFYIPYQMAYGERAQGQKIKPFSALIFEVEMLEIIAQ